MKLLILLTASILIPLCAGAHAQTSYDIRIPAGAVSPNAPYFWVSEETGVEIPISSYFYFSEKTGVPTGDINILVGDTVVWKNTDTAAHTVTSGSAAGGPDDLFDSGLFAPGISFMHEFTQKGDFPYFCIVHPWMEGTVYVTPNYSIIPDVGSEVGDGSVTANIPYDFDRVLSATVNEEQKSITFEIIGEAESASELELIIDASVIASPFVVWVDGQLTTEYEKIYKNRDWVFIIPLEADSKTLTIAGSAVIPEFGALAMAVLGVSIAIVLLASRRSGFSPLPRI